MTNEEQKTDNIQGNGALPCVMPRFYFFDYQHFIN